MSFQPSKYSYGSTDDVTVEHQNVDPIDEVGLLITAEENPQSAVNAVIGLGTMLAGGYTAARSYKRNQSIGWALLAWLGWPIALPYFTMTPDKG